jgi:hypothetical protein
VIGPHGAERRPAGADLSKTDGSVHESVNPLFLLQFQALPLGI